MDTKITFYYCSLKVGSINYDVTINGQNKNILVILMCKSKIFYLVIL